ncbi:unnamed protein product, partial [Staurois parvus]
MIRCLLGHMTGPRRRWAIHKAQCFLRICGHPAVTEAGPGRSAVSGQREGQLRGSGSG